MRVALVVDLGRDDGDAPVPHTALGNDALGEVLDLGHRSPEQRNFHAAVVVEGYAHMAHYSGPLAVAPVIRDFLRAHASNPSA